MQKCNVMLFAAGLGTRLRPATNLHPKPTIPLLGHPLGYYLFPYLQKIQISQFVVNTFHLSEQIHDLYLDCKSKINGNLKFSDEKDFIKGSGGGLKLAQQLLSSSASVLVCNSDEVLFTKDASFLLRAFEAHENKNAFATLIVTKHELAGTKFGAIWCDSHGRVVDIGKEAPSEEAISWHFVGLQILSPGIFKSIPDNIESNIFYDVLVHLLEKERVHIFSIEADWYETGNLVDYATAKNQIGAKLKTESHYQKHFEILQEFTQLARLKMSDLT